MDADPDFHNKILFSEEADFRLNSHDNPQDIVK